MPSIAVDQSGNIAIGYAASRRNDHSQGFVMPGVLLVIRQVTLAKGKLHCLPAPAARRVLAAGAIIV